MQAYNICNAYTKCIKKFEKHKVFTITIDNEKEIIIKIIELLERQKDANNS